jgi:choline dehydrogenase-like flavoprotein
MAEQADVVVVGAGVMGCGTAYWLTRAGQRVLVLEQEAIACGASGMAAAMLESVGHGARLLPSDPLAELARASFTVHQVCAGAGHRRGTAWPGAASRRGRGIGEAARTCYWRAPTKWRDHSGHNRGARHGPVEPESCELGWFNHSHLPCTRAVARIACS